MHLNRKSLKGAEFLENFIHVYKIIGISGGSGAGKTTLANTLLEHYAGEALVISYDRYYKRMECGNYDLPESLDTELLLKHLHLLKSGQGVGLPIYDRINNQRTAAVEWVEPKPVIIVEGIFALHPPELLELYHLKVYVDVPNNSIRYHRRMIRDIRERGDTEAKVTKAWTENVLPTHYRLIQPQKARAEVVVSGVGDLAEGEFSAVLTIGQARAIAGSSASGTIVRPMQENEQNT
jgi:uridine kinase